MSLLRHTRIVTSLYRKLLRQHRNLPLDMQAVGIQYVKDEFKRHKAVDPGQAQIFLSEWKNFSEMLDEQLKSNVWDLGTDITDKLDDFSNEQIAQLYELQQAAVNPGEEESNAK